MVAISLRGRPGLRRRKAGFWEPRSEAQRALRGATRDLGSPGTRQRAAWASSRICGRDPLNGSLNFNRQDTKFLVAPHETKLSTAAHVGVGGYAARRGRAFLPAVPFAGGVLIVSNAGPPDSHG